MEKISLYFKCQQIVDTVIMSLDVTDLEGLRFQLDTHDKGYKLQDFTKDFRGVFSEYSSDYYYSVYTSELLLLMSEHPKIWHNLIDFAIEFGYEIDDIDDLLLVNIIAFDYILDSYKHMSLLEIMKDYQKHSTYNAVDLLELDYAS